MWKKEEPSTSTETNAIEADRARTDRPAPIQAQAHSERATIGRSITVRGDVTGDEDLLIQGRVEGSIDLQQHAVTVGAEGEVNASISGRIVTVEGRVEGNITAEEQAILKSSAFVRGDITAPRVVLENGARFRGGVDMGDVEDRGKRNAVAAVKGRGSDTAKSAIEPMVAPASSAAALAASANGPSGESATSLRA